MGWVKHDDGSRVLTVPHMGKATVCESAVELGTWDARLLFMSEDGPSIRSGIVREHKGGHATEDAAKAWCVRQFALMHDAAGEALGRAEDDGAKVADPWGYEA